MTDKELKEFFGEIDNIIIEIDSLFPDITKQENASGKKNEHTMDRSKSDILNDDFSYIDDYINIGKSILDDEKIKSDNRKRNTGKKIFYFIIVPVLFISLVMIIFANRGGVESGNLFNYSYFSLQANGAHSDVPEGSLIIMKYVTPDTVSAEDDIVFVYNNKITAVGKVKNIYKNYNGSGKLVFELYKSPNYVQTNLLVPEDKLMGSVTFHASVLGTVVDFIESNMWVVFLILLILYLYFSKSPRIETEKNKVFDA